MTDIRFQGCAPIEWPNLLGGYPPFNLEETVVLIEDGLPNSTAGVVFEYKKLKFLCHIHKLIESYAITVHLLNENDEEILNDPIVCKAARRLRVLVLSPISSERLIEACDMLITASIHNS
jgi:hypothetical protein